MSTGGIFLRPGLFMDFKGREDLNTNYWRVTLLDSDGSTSGKLCATI